MNRAEEMRRLNEADGDGDEVISQADDKVKRVEREWKNENLAEWE